MSTSPSEALKAARARRKLTMRQVAEQLGISVSHVWNIEHDTQEPTWSLGQRILEWSQEWCGCYHTQPFRPMRKDDCPLHAEQ